jgi:hypothetical protein
VLDQLAYEQKAMKDRGLAKVPKSGTVAPGQPGADATVNQQDPAAAAA